MGKSLSVFLILQLLILSSAVVSVAGSRYHSPAYRNNRHFRPHIQYYNHHRSHRSYYSSSDILWTHLGVGLLTGAVVGSMFHQPPRQQTIVYNNPPPVIVQSKPVIIKQQYIHAVPRPELVLRRVRTTAELLNVRFGPGPGTTVTSQVQQGAILDVIGAAPEWLYIKTAKGQYGWVMTQYTIDAGGPVG